MPQNDRQQPDGIAVDHDGSIAVFYRGAKVSIGLTPAEMYEFADAVIRAAIRLSLIDEARAVEAAAIQASREQAEAGEVGHA